MDLGVYLHPDIPPFAPCRRGCQRAGGAGGGQLPAAGHFPLPHHHHPGGELLRGDAGLSGVPAAPRLSPSLAAPSCPEGDFSCVENKAEQRAGCVQGGDVGSGGTGALSRVSARNEGSKDRPTAAAAGGEQSLEAGSLNFPYFYLAGGKYS